MSRRFYSPAERANALVHLEKNAGDIILTARQLGIPERTLYTWRRQWYEEHQRRQTPSPSSPINRPEFDDDLDALAYLRKQIMDELLNMADSFREGTMFTSPAQRIHLLSQLLDRLMKLDQHLRPYQPPEGIRITWQTGLYIRTDGGYRGPYAPSDLPKRWKEKFGSSARLEIYWDDSTFNPLPDEGVIPEFIFDVRDFQDEHCDMAPDNGYDFSYD